MIRKFDEKDLHAVMELWLESNIEAHDFIDSRYWKENYSKVEEMLPQAEIYVYEEAKKIAGFIGLTGNYIAGIFVGKACRSNGIGRRLLDYVKEERETLMLQVYEKNRRAVCFYKREGFYIVQEQTEEGTGEKEFLMEWKKKMEIKIRKMDPSEYELLSDFLYEAIFQRDENNRLPREIIQEPELRIYIEDFGEKKHDHCLCAVADDVIVGAVWTRIIKGYGSVDDSIPEFAVSIRRGFRGNGIGTALMEQMIELLKREGCEKASLAVQKDNYAVRMYQKTGFSIIDENEEEYIMMIDLKENE